MNIQVLDINIASAEGLQEVMRFFVNEFSEKLADAEKYIVWKSDFNIQARLIDVVNIVPRNNAYLFV